MTELRHHTRQTNKKLSDLFNLPDLDGELEPTKHAENEAENERYGSFTLPDAAKINEDQLQIYHEDFQSEGQIFEIAREPGQTNVHRLAARCDYDDEKDIVLVLNDTGHIITAWLNMKEDQHETLDLDQYDPIDNND